MKIFNKIQNAGLAIVAGAFKIVAFVFRSFLLHCHAEVRSNSSIDRDASYLSMTKTTILNAPIVANFKLIVLFVF